MTTTLNCNNFTIQYIKLSKTLNLQDDLLELTSKFTSSEMTYYEFSKKLKILQSKHDANIDSSDRKLKILEDIIEKKK